MSHAQSWSYPHGVHHKVATQAFGGTPSRNVLLEDRSDNRLQFGMVLGVAVD